MLARASEVKSTGRATFGTSSGATCTVERSEHSPRGRAPQKTAGGTYCFSTLRSFSPWTPVAAREFEDLYSAVFLKQHHPQVVTQSYLLLAYTTELLHFLSRRTDECRDELSLRPEEISLGRVQPTGPSCHWVRIAGIDGHMALA